MNVKKENKDDERARMDMGVIYQRGDLVMVPLKNGKMAKPKAIFCLTSREAKLVFQWIKELKMPDGYASNMAICANVDTRMMHRMKSHDFHVFIECLLPLAFSSLSDHVWKPLTKLS